MNIDPNERAVECHRCGKTFPVAVIKDAEEARQAEAALEEGGGTVRVARWCPWCSATNMVDLPIELIDEEVTFMGVDTTLAGLPPEEQDTP